jgi:hypothetical protein
MANKKTISDSTLDRYWSKAVKKMWNYRCAVCGSTSIQAHHVVRRSKRVLRWDFRNGIALCPECHAWAHTTAGRMRVEMLMPMAYLAELDVPLVDYCHEHELTRDEFRQEKLKELKELKEYLNG